MARSKSEDKRRAILEAAERIFAERGIASAPTSAISRAAGVAEGTLFNYFKTKDELMDELYMELRQEFSRHLTEFPEGQDARTRMRYIWDKFLDLGATKPEELRVLTQLRASGRLFRGNESPSFAVTAILGVIEEAVARGELRSAPPDYLVLMIRAQLEMTVEYINAHPDRGSACREIGFMILWRGLTGA